jgi:hypothetical protein
MNSVAKQFGLFVLAVSTFSLNLLLDSAVQAQDATAIVDINYDDKQPNYDFGFRFGGYKKKGPAELVDIYDQLSKRSRKLTTGGNEGGAFEVSLDNSKTKIPELKDLDFAYIGLGLGISGNVVDYDFSKFEVANFKVVFDAKIENAKLLERSRVELQFITSDGKGPTPDADTEDDLLCKMKYGGSSSVDKIELTNQFQTFEIELADMEVQVGSIEQVKKFNTRGVTLIVVAEEDPDHFGIGGQTKLTVDNYRLIQK